jgi:hypothetical protein
VCTYRANARLGKATGNLQAREHVDPLLVSTCATRIAILFYAASAAVKEAVAATPWCPRRWTLPVLERFYPNALAARPGHADALRQQYAEDKRILISD